MFVTFRKIALSLFLLLALLMVLENGTIVLAASAKPAQKSFASPEEAVKSLMEALRSNNNGELLAILGPGSQEIISSGDPVADRSDRERVIRLYGEKVVIEGATTGRAVVALGSEDYPFPIPVVKKGSSWRFDAKAGKEEILNRRIGRNELAIIDILHSYVDAQREYAATDWEGDGAWEFAQKFQSTPGKRDGLYWKVKEGEKGSPFGPLAAKAAREGYSKENTALHGYYFKILKAQGKDGDGGAFDYRVKGKMILGFAMVAYPAQYGSSGVMTFMVSHNGIIYQKNLGKNSARIASSMTLFNPDASWKKVE
jgi:hypothetical protein